MYPRPFVKVQIIMLIIFVIIAVPVVMPAQAQQEKTTETVKIRVTLKASEAMLSEAQKENNKQKEAEALFNIGVEWKKLLVYDKASEYLIKSQKLFEDLKDNKKIARNYLHLGELYRAIAEYEPAISYSKKALELFEQESDKHGIAKACDRLSAIYYEIAPSNVINIDSVFMFSAKCLNISISIADDSLTCSIRNIIGAAYLYSGKKELGIAYLQDVLSFAEDKKLKDEAALVKINIAYGYYSKKDYYKAIEYAKQTYEYADKLRILPFIDMSTLCLFRSFKELGDFKNAFYYLEVYDSNRWQLYDDNRIHRIKALQIKYETDKKELELRHEKKTSLLWTVLFLAIIFAGVLLIGVFIYRHRLLKKKNSELKKKNTLISEQNEKLVELNATKDKFFSIIAHDLKNPYQSLLGFSDILIQDYKDLSEKEIKEFVGYIYEASDMGNRLLQNLLDWSRSETGKIKYEPELFFLYEIVDEAVNLASNTAKQKDIAINAPIDKNLEVYCDRNMVYTVLRNLVSNAIKFSFRGGVIEIKSKCSESYIEISISDNGVGMDSVLMEDLFKIEKRITNDGTENEKGTGLGLFLCKEFIEKNHGTISVRSEVGKGSTFIVSLPNHRNGQ